MLLFFILANYVIIPEGDGSQNVKNIINSDNKIPVWEKYNQEYNNIKDDLGKQFSSGIFGWDSIYSFFRHLIKLVSNLGLAAGAIMIIYGGYLYMTQVFTGNVEKGKKAIKNALIGLILLISSYAIMNILIRFFL